jgi:hypothetical protein
MDAGGQTQLEELLHTDASSWIWSFRMCLEVCQLSFVAMLSSAELAMDVLGAIY